MNKSLTSMDPALRKMVRIAYHSTDPKVRRGFATYVSKIAHYSGGFTQWVKGQKFRHPETGKTLQEVGIDYHDQTDVCVVAGALLVVVVWVRGGFDET